VLLPLLDPRARRRVLCASWGLCAAFAHARKRFRAPPFAEWCPQPALDAAAAAFFAFLGTLWPFLAHLSPGRAPPPSQPSPAPPGARAPPRGRAYRVGTRVTGRGGSTELPEWADGEEEGGAVGADGRRARTVADAHAEWLPALAMWCPPHPWSHSRPAPPRCGARPTPRQACAPAPLADRGRLVRSSLAPRWSHCAVR
jgi:hypothetical protein